jgi:hypothetical protein
LQEQVGVLWLQPCHNLQQPSQWLHTLNMP